MMNAKARRDRITPIIVIWTHKNSTTIECQIDWNILGKIEQQKQHNRDKTTSRKNKKY